MNSPRPERTIWEGDGLAFLEEQPLSRSTALVTSLPDVSEVGKPFASWRAWFIDAARLVVEKTPDTSVAIFYQTDIKHEGTWIDKGHLVMLGAEATGASLLFHRIVCRAPAGTTTWGRPSYAHLLAFSKKARLSPGQSSADVLPAMGGMTWPRATPARACDAIMNFLVTHTNTEVVCDPFCGVGTILAFANVWGLHAVGVELSRKRAQKARTLDVSSLSERSSLGSTGHGSS